MRSWTLTVAAIALAVPMSGVAVAPAEAGCCSVLYNKIGREHVGTRRLISTSHSDTRTAVNEHTTQVGNYIVDNILKATQQLSAYESRTAESNKRVEEGAQANETVRKRQEMRALAEGGRYDPAASSCTDMTGVLNMGGGASAQGIGGQDVANVSRNRSNGNGPEGEAVRRGGLAIAQEIINDRDRLAGIGGVLDPTTDVRLLSNNMTLDTTDEGVKAAYARLVNNLIDPVPARPVTEGEKATPAGYAQIAARQIDSARRSPAHDVMAHIGDLHAPTGGPELAEWAQNAATEAYPNQIGDKVSTLQTIDVFVHSRFANPEWHQQLAMMSPEAVMRETALMNALNLHVNWMRYQLEMKDALVGATQLAAQLDDRDAGSTSGALPASINSGTVPAAPGLMNASVAFDGGV